MHVLWLLMVVFFVIGFFFFKQKTAYEMRISDWSSDVCSSETASAGLHRCRWLRPKRSVRRSCLTFPVAENFLAPLEVRGVLHDNCGTMVKMFEQFPISTSIGLFAVAIAFVWVAILLWEKFCRAPNR